MEKLIVPYTPRHHTEKGQRNSDVVSVEWLWCVRMKGIQNTDYGLLFRQRTISVMNRSVAPQKLHNYFECKSLSTGFLNYVFPIRIQRERAAVSCFLFSHDVWNYGGACFSFDRRVCVATISVLSFSSSSNFLGFYCSLFSCVCSLWALSMQSSPVVDNRTFSINRMTRDAPHTHTCVCVFFSFDFGVSKSKSKSC